LIIVGQCNPYPGTEPLSRVPGSAGERLYRLFAEAGITQEQYDAIPKTNLLRGTFWSRREAKYHAGPVLAHLGRTDLLLLGRDVVSAMSLRVPRPLTWVSPGYAMLPHPSGLNRWYNDPVNRRAAVHFLATAYANS
jgi:hypothetical protein